MKKAITVFLAIVLLVLSLCSCGKSVEYGKCVKVADRLYEVTYNDYDYDYLLSDGYGNSEFIGYGCSAIKHGDFLGRNFDFIAGDSAEIVVKTTPKKDRYASIGICGGLLWFSRKFMDNGLDEDAKKLIPLLILDGINEKGLAIETNCVNTADVGGLTVHTNNGKKQVAQLGIVRYLLDKAATADEAINLLKKIDIVNIRNVMGLKTYKYEIHFLITDRNNTYVVELNNTKPENEKLIILKDEKIMTNFYLHLSDVENGIYPDNSIGVERYRKLYDNKDTVNSLESMKKLMQSVRYTNSNKTTGEYDPGADFSNKYTCYSDHPIFGENPINYANCKLHLEEIIQSMKEDEVEIAKVLRDPDMKNPNSLWCTSHSAVYDLKNKTMSVAVYEKFDKYYNYSF